MRSLMIGALSAIFTTAAMAQMQNTGPLNKDFWWHGAGQQAKGANRGNQQQLGELTQAWIESGAECPN